MKRVNRTLYAMMLMFCLMFSVYSVAVNAAEETKPETSQTEITQPQTETPQSETAPQETETETELIKGFKSPVAYVIKGQKIKLETQNLQGKLRWKSSKKKVADINKKGVITGKKRGRSIITVYEGKVPYTCKLIVETPSISKQAVNVLAGAAYRLKVKGTAQKVVWKSSNKKIASVNKKGLVTAKKKGTVTITAKIGKVKYKCKVTVEEPKISQKKLTIKCGESAKLSIGGTTKKVKWYSKDKSIATVNNGIVTAKKVGTVRITAKVGNDVMRCKVTVVDNPITEVKLNKEELTLVKGAEKELEVTILPSTTTHSKKITWSSSDPSVAEVNAEGKVTAVGVGTATIKATAGEKSDTCKVTVKPTMTMKYADIISYVQKNGKRNEEGNLVITSKPDAAISSIEIDHITGRLVFGYHYTSQYNTVKITMEVDVPKNAKVNPTLHYATSNQQTSYQAAANIEAAVIKKGKKLDWKLFNATDKVQEGAIQTTCNNKFYEAMAGWQNILKTCTGYELADIGFSAYTEAK